MALSDQSTPLALALNRLINKRPIVAALDSAMWDDVPVALRDRAIWMATVEHLRFIDAVQAKLVEAVEEIQTRPDKAYVGRQKFVTEMRELARSYGLDTGRPDLTNPASVKRLRLVYDFQMEDIYSYGRRETDARMSGALAAYPAQELVRISNRKVPREWRERWVAAGGTLYEGRMVARKDADIWQRISRFERPWPPFDYNSGMGLEGVRRREAIRLGVMTASDKVDLANSNFNQELESSVKDISPENQLWLDLRFGRQVEVDTQTGTAKWRGDRP